MSVPMAPVTVTRRPTFVGGIGSGRTRMEQWAADTLDGVWHFERIDGEPGTPWACIHRPSGEEVCWLGSLPKCRRAAASGNLDRQREINP